MTKIPDLKSDWRPIDWDKVETLDDLKAIVIAIAGGPERQVEFNVKANPELKRFCKET